MPVPIFRSSAGFYWDAEYTAGGRSQFVVPRSSHVNENPIKFALLVAFGIGFGAAEPAEIDVTVIDYRFVAGSFKLPAWRPLSLASCEQGQANP